MTFNLFKHIIQYESWKLTNSIKLYWLKRKHPDIYEHFTDDMRGYSDSDQVKLFAVMNTIREAFSQYDHYFQGNNQITKAFIKEHVTFINLIK